MHIRNKIIILLTVSLLAPVSVSAWEVSTPYDDASCELARVWGKHEESCITFAWKGGFNMQARAKDDASGSIVVGTLRETFKVNSGPLLGDGFSAPVKFLGSAKGELGCPSNLLDQRVFATLQIHGQLLDATGSELERWKIHYGSCIFGATRIYDNEIFELKTPEVWFQSGETYDLGAEVRIDAITTTGGCGTAKCGHSSRAVFAGSDNYVSVGRIEIPNQHPITSTPNVDDWYALSLVGTPIRSATCDYDGGMIGLHISADGLKADLRNSQTWQYDPAEACAEETAYFRWAYPGTYTANGCGTDTWRAQTCDSAKVNIHTYPWQTSNARKHGIVPSTSELQAFDASQLITITAHVSGEREITHLEIDGGPVPAASWNSGAHETGENAVMMQLDRISGTLTIWGDGFSQPVTRGINQHGTHWWNTEVIAEGSADISSIVSSHLP